MLFFELDEVAKAFSAPSLGRGLFISSVQFVTRLLPMCVGATLVLFLTPRLQLDTRHSRLSIACQSVPPSW